MKLEPLESYIKREHGTSKAFCIEHGLPTNYPGKWKRWGFEVLTDDSGNVRLVSTRRVLRRVAQ